MLFSCYSFFHGMATVLSLYRLDTVTYNSFAIGANYEQVIAKQ